MFGPFSKKPAGLGATAGRLAPCPDTPNCVSSQADPADQAHHVAPFRIAGAVDAAWDRLAVVLESQPRMRITLRTGDYLHAEARTILFRFVDDVEFLSDPAAGLIHVRSASRVGVTDLGVNRKRIEAIRAAFDRAASKSA